MKRDIFTLNLDLGHELVIDNFAGGGGTSTGLEWALGRPVDIAINHDPEALAMHALNHPYTKHLCESVWEVDPIAVTGNQPVGLVWLSPDCKHFSKAKGGTPVSKNIRGLAWVGLRWIATTRPRMMMLENVEEFQDWGPLVVDADGNARPDPKKRGRTFQSFVRQLRSHGYSVEWSEMRACDQGAPTIRKRLFLVARRDGIPIHWGGVSYAPPTDSRVIAGLLAAHRTAAQCIDFDLPAESIFGRKRNLVTNTLRRVAKGVFRHVLNTATPFIVNTRNGEREGQQPRIRELDAPYWTVTSQGSQGALAAPVLAPFINEHANGSNQRTMPADQPLRTVCAQVKGGHFSLVSPTMVTLRGTAEAQLNGKSVAEPLSTVTANGQHHAMAAAHITKFNTGAVGSAMDEPLPTITAGGKPKRPSTGITMGMVAAHLVDMGHGEGPAGGKRWSHGTRNIEMPLNTVTASGATSSLAAICFEQAYGGFYDGDGRPANEPLSTITTSGTQQRLITACLVKYYSEGGQDSSCNEPMHTVPTKARMALVQSAKVPAAHLAPEHAERAKLCAALLREHLPDQFPDPADVVLMWHGGQWWALVDITLRMLKPRELARAQGFPDSYHIDEIPDPAILFKDGVQAVDDPRDIPRIKLSTTAQVRMIGNSVSPYMAEALARWNFQHEARMFA